MRPHDAALAVAAGADAIGMIFHPPTRRCIPTDTARQIVQAIGPFVTPVGVFVDAPTTSIISTAEAACIRTIQLHGEETPGDVLELGKMGYRCIKAVKVNEGFAAQLDLWRLAMPDLQGMLIGLLLESPASQGGSGVANDFQAIARCREQGSFTGLPPLVIAGGLDPRNVGDVVRLLRPHAVDVSSGVEETVGEKSQRKLHDFAAAVQAADLET